MKRKTISMFLLVALMLSLAACGTASGGNGTESTTTAPAGSAAGTTAATTAKEPAEIVFWDMEWGPADSYIPTAEKLTSKFTADNPNITVKYQSTPWDSYYQTFLTAVSSGSAPDVSTGAFPQSIQYAKMGEILYLDSIIDQWKSDGSNILDDFMPGSIDMFKYDGKQAGIPWERDPRMITYRKDIFEKAGITQMPATFDDFIADCKAIKDKTGVIPFVFPTLDKGGMHVFLNFMFGNNVGITDDKGTPDMQDPKVMTVLKFFQTMYDDKLLPAGIANYKEADAENLYKEGKVAMIFTGSPTFLAGTDVEKNSSILPPIGGPDGQPHNLTWVASIMAYNQTKQPDASKAFIKWWLENNLPLWTEGKAGPYPIRQSFMSDSYFTGTWYSKEFAEKVAPSCILPHWPMQSLYYQFAQIEGEDYLSEPIKQVLMGDKDLDGIAAKTNDTIKKALTAQ